jgi:hypothetical protein
VPLAAFESSKAAHALVVSTCCRRLSANSFVAAILLCLRSGKSRSLFCYDCLVPFTSIPDLQLPFQLHIITHAAERSTKATGVHAAVLCKGKVHLQRWGPEAHTPAAAAAT